MLAKKCPKCGAVWYTALPKCAFCGIEGVEQPTSTHTGRLPEKPVPAALPEPEKPAAAVAIAEATPVPPTSPEASARAAEDPPGALEAPPVMPEPAPVVETRPVLEEKRAPTQPPPPSLLPLAPDLKKPDLSKLPPAPQVPSSTMPIVFGLLGLAACVILPVAAFTELDRMVKIMAYLAGAILLPFAPLAWLAGRRYEDRCIELGFHPAGSGRAGRILGMTVTILISLEGSVLAFLAAIRLIAPGK